MQNKNTFTTALCIAFFLGLPAIANLANSSEIKADKDSQAVSVTADNQSDSASDLKITQKIRQRVMKDRNLSTAAQNIKIITINGEVTLRGSVKTSGEQAVLVERARRVAGVRSVVDQIDIDNK